MIRITDTIVIGEREFSESFVRASGPGGQNVNKVETAVQLRFDVKNSPSLPADVKARLSRLAGRRLTKDGEIVIDARRFRTQAQNRADARARLVALIGKAAVPPRRRKPTKVSSAQKRRRLEGKRRRSEVKAGRTRGPSADD